MAKAKEKTPLTKANGWVSSFNIVGQVKINDYTFKLDEKSNKSDWIYNTMNLGIDCGERYGTVYCEAMGGYGAERQNVLYVHGKDEKGNDDFKNQYQIDWEDRFTESIVEDIGDLCFMTAGLEKTSQDKTFYKKFLTPYDFIAYCAEHLEDGMVVNVRGQLRYTVYNDTVQCRKEINSIALSKAEPKDYKAVFTQTMLIDRDSASKDTIDKEKGVINVTAHVLEKFREYNGWDLTENGKNRGGLFVPLRKIFEYEIDREKPELTIAILNKVFKVKKDVNQITWEGDFIESGAVIQTTEENLSEEIKQMINLGFYTLEEALAVCAGNGVRERRMVIRRPFIKRIDGENEGEKIPQLQIFEGVYTDDDMDLYYLTKKVVDDESEEDDKPPFNEDVDLSPEDDEDDELARLLADL